MRKPCKCSTRLCGWEESAAGFIGRPAGPREPRVNRSPVWCLLTEITGEGRACHFFKLKCKSTSANNGDGSRFYRNVPKDSVSRELPQHKHRTQWSWSSFLLRKQSRNICSKVEPYLKLSTDLNSSMSAYHEKQLSKQRDEIYLLAQMCRDFYAVL